MAKEKKVQQKEPSETRNRKLHQAIRKWAGWFLIGVIVIVLVIKLGNIKVAKERTGENNITEAIVSTGVQQIKASEYDKLTSQPEVFVVDVHVPEQNHLPNTDAFIPFDQIQARVNDLPVDKATPIMVYCRSGGMSKQASAELVSMGYQTVYDLSGGKNAYDAIKTSVELEPKVQDLGIVVYGEVARAEFELKNNSTQTVEIKRVSTSCSCTKAEVAEKSLAPQASTMVNVSFDPAVHKDNPDLGDVTRTIFIDTNHPEFSEVTASIKARVVKQENS